jgi:hypothetical protein
MAAHMPDALLLISLRSQYRRLAFRLDPGQVGEMIAYLKSTER